MINWPTNILPLPQIQYSGTTDPVLIENQFEVGMRQRSAFDHAEDEKQVQLRLKDEFLFEYFKSWHFNVLKQGSMSFWMPLPGVDGMDVLTEVVMIEGVFSWTFDSGTWLVGFNLRAENPALADAGIVEFLASLEDGTPEEFMSMCDVLHLQLNQFYGHSEDSPIVTQFINTYG